MVAHPHQLAPKGAHGVGAADSGVYVRAGKPSETWLPSPMRFPFGAVGGRIAGLDNRQAVLQTNRIRCAADAYTGTAQQIRDAVTIHGSVHEGNAVEHDMRVQMCFVQMCGYHDLVSLCQKAQGQLYTYRMGLLRRDLAGGEGLDHMIALALAVELPPTALGIRHVRIGSLPVTVQCGFKAVLLGLIPVHGVVQHRFQRGLFLVLRIGQAPVQSAMNDNDLCVCHSKPFPYKPCGLPHQMQRFRDLVTGGGTSGVGLMGQLVDVIPDGGQRAEQIGIGVGGTRAEIYAHNELPHQRLLFQPGHFCLSAQVCVLRSVQAKCHSFIWLYRLVPPFG